MLGNSMYRQMLISMAKTQYGIDIDEEMLNQIEKISELIEQLMVNLQQKKSKYQLDKTKSLQKEIESLAKELLREVYGFYNTESGADMSSSDRKQIDQEIDMMIREGLSLLEKLAGMNEKE